MYKNVKRITKSNDSEIQEYKFHQYKSSFWINNIDIKKTVVCNKFPFGKQDSKYFIGYKDSKTILKS